MFNSPTFIRGIHNFKPEHRGTVATIGSFDGVHLGHRQIVEQVKAAARRFDLPSTVITFEPQPHEYFSAEKAPARLMRFREKYLALREAGVDWVCCLPFNQRFRSLSAKEFVEQILVEGLGVRYLVVGDDFRFGCDRSGDYDMLVNEGARYGFDVTDTTTFEIAGKRVSSTRIRESLSQCRFAEAEELLGRPFRITGRVGYGQQLGRQLGVPTANVQLRRYRAPLQGVYTVEFMIEGCDQPNVGVANVGVRPTVSDQVRPILEVHLLDYSGDLYGKKVSVKFLHKLREEQKFESVDALKQQIHQDISDAKAWFSQAVSETQ